MIRWSVDPKPFFFRSACTAIKIFFDGSNSALPMISTPLSFKYFDIPYRSSCCVSAAGRFWSEQTHRTVQVRDPVFLLGEFRTGPGKSRANHGRSSSIGILETTRHSFVYFWLYWYCFCLPTTRIFRLNSRTQTSCSTYAMSSVKLAYCASAKHCCPVMTT